VILKLTGNNGNGRIEHQPLPQDDPKQRCPDITRAGRLLGWSPKVHLDQGLRLTVEIFPRSNRKVLSARCCDALCDKSCREETGPRPPPEKVGLSVHVSADSPVVAVVGGRTSSGQRRRPHPNKQGLRNRNIAEFHRRNVSTQTWSDPWPRLRQRYRRGRQAADVSLRPGRAISAAGSQYRPQGGFEFRNVDPGDYTLSCSKTGLWAASLRREVVECAGREDHSEG